MGMAFFMKYLRHLPQALALCMLAIAAQTVIAAERRTDGTMLVWLEDSNSKRTRDWIAARQAETASLAKNAGQFSALLTDVRQISSGVPPFLTGSFHGADYVELRVDAEHPFGLWQKTSLRRLFSGKPQWQQLYAGNRDNSAPGTLVATDCLPPDYRQCLLFFRTATGLTVLREFDTVAGAFVTDGFTVGPAPLSAAWYDENTLLIASDTGAGSLTEGGAPRLVRLWRRGTAIHEARTVFAGNPDDQLVRPVMSLTPGGLFHAVERVDSQGHRALFHLAWEQNLVRSSLPETARFLGFFQGRAIAVLADAWRLDGQMFPAGSLIAYPMAPLLAPQRRMTVELAYTPTAGEAVIDALTARDTLFVTLHKGGQRRIVSLRKGAPTWRFRTEHVAKAGADISLLSGSELGDILLARSGTQLVVIGGGRMRVAGTLPGQPASLRLRFDNVGPDSVMVTPVSAQPGQPLLVEITDDAAPLPDTGNALSPLTRWHLGKGGRALLIQSKPLPAADDGARIAALVQAQATASQRVVLTARGQSAGAAIRAALDTPRPFSALLLFTPDLSGAGAPTSPAIRTKITPVPFLQRITRRATLPPVLIAETPPHSHHLPAQARKLAERLRSQGHSVRYHESDNYPYALALGALYLSTDPAISPTQSSR